MTAETLGASQVQAIQHASGNHHTCHDEFLRELAHACASQSLLNGCNAAWVGWTKGVSTDNRNTTAMVLTGRLSSLVTTLAPN